MKNLTTKFLEYVDLHQDEHQPAEVLFDLFCWSHLITSDQRAKLRAYLEDKGVL